MILPLLELELAFAAESEVRFLEFAGSAWRGALGHALKRMVCVMRLRPCAGCPLEFSCPYPSIFEARPPPDARKMRRYERIPQPFVLDPLTPVPCTLAPGDPFRLRLVLVGRASRSAVYVLKALEEGAARGVGIGFGRLRLASIRRHSPRGAAARSDGGALSLEPEPVPIPERPQRVRVVLERPLRLAQDGRLLGPERFRPYPFLMALLRRVSMLSEFYGEGPLEVDFRALKEEARRVEAGAVDLTWREQKRRSARQGGMLRMGGIVGSFTLDLDRAPDFWPFLWLGQKLHLGKGASMGLGRYRLEGGPAGLPPAAGGVDRARLYSGGDGETDRP